MSIQKIHFVTGKLAEFALREVLVECSAEFKFEYTLQVLPISVAALMTTEWVGKHLQIPTGTTKVILPGYCRGATEVLTQKFSLPFEVGPKDLRRLPEYFGGKRRINVVEGEFDIQIVAEINHAPRFSLEQLESKCFELKRDGADLIDLGCNPGEIWRELEPVARHLTSRGYRLSVDSLNPAEIASAVRGGVELVLSANSENREQVVDLDCEFVLIPDDPKTLAGLNETVDFFKKRGKRFRIDPILEPIGFGFAASLERYSQVRRSFPEDEILMGIGNLTELTDVDSAGVNALLIGFCQELGIRSVLTTQVINWAKSSVREIDLARRLMFHAVTKQVPPKRLMDELLVARDPELKTPTVEEMENLAKRITDHNYRIFAFDEMIHLVTSDVYLRNADPFKVFDDLEAMKPRNLDPSHAFYLGFEMCKAAMALMLSKEYTQDEALRFGYLTRPEGSRHRLAKRRPPAPDQFEKDLPQNSSSNTATLTTLSASNAPTEEAALNRLPEAAKANSPPSNSSESEERKNG